MSRKELGEILLEADLINQSQLSEALGLQETFGERLASILVRKRMITEKFAVTYLGRQLGVTPVDLSRTELDLDLLDLVPLDLCGRHRVFPIRIENGRLLLAMCDPRDEALIERVEADTGARLTPLVALESSIKHAIAEARVALQKGQRILTPSIQTRDLSGSGPTSLQSIEPEEPSPRALGPGEDNGHASAPEASAEEDLTVGDKPTILVAVGTGAGVVNDLTAKLRDQGYRILTAATGRDVLALVRRTLPDLVLADGMLPELDGYEACRKIKSDERFRGMPVILLTTPGLGWRFAADVKTRYEADEVMERNCELSDLERRVDFHLNRPAPGASPATEAKVRELLKEGVVALKKNEHDDAVNVLNSALEIDAFNDLVHYYVAMAHEKLGRLFQAIQHYEQAVQLNPEFQDAIASLANLYQSNGFRNKAVDMWELALQTTRDEQARERMKQHILDQL